MRIALAFGLLALVSSVVACSSAPPPTARPTQPSAGVENQTLPQSSSTNTPLAGASGSTVRVVDTDRDGTKTLEVDGPYVTAGMKFPVRLAGFTRGTISEYKSRALGRAIGYHQDANGTKVTIYVFGDGADLAGHYEGSKDAITDRSVGTLLAESEVELNANGSWYRGKLAHYELQTAAGMTQSVLVVYSMGGVYLKYRVTTAVGSPLDEAAHTKLRNALGAPTTNEL